MIPSDIPLPPLPPSPLQFPPTEQRMPYFLWHSSNILGSPCPSLNILYPATQQSSARKKIKKINLKSPLFPFSIPQKSFSFLQISPSSTINRLITEAPLRMSSPGSACILRPPGAVPHRGTSFRSAPNSSSPMPRSAASSLRVPRLKTPQLLLPAKARPQWLLAPSWCPRLLMVCRWRSGGMGGGRRGGR